MTEKRIERLIKILIGCTFFVPLVVLPNTFIFPFIVPKIIVFRSLVLLMLGGYIVLCIGNIQKYAPKKTKINIVLCLFFLSMIISTFVGVDWYKSFWDNHERMLGLFTMFHYFLFYIVATSVIRKPKEWIIFFRLFLFAGSIVMLVGVWQKFVNTDALLNRGSDRVSATLGNAIYYSYYGVFLFFVGIFLIAKENSMQWRYYAGVCSFIGVVGMFLGGTRGALVGLVASMVFVLFLYLVSLKQHKNIRRAILILFGIGIICFGLLFAYRQTEFVKSIPTVGRMLNLNLSYTGGSSVTTRFLAWRSGFYGWQDKPVFGWGPNNFLYVFNLYYDPVMLNFGYGETWFDNPHNALVNILVTQGIFGLVLYLAVFITPMVLLWKAYKKNSVSLHFFVLISGYLVFHIISQLFAFENPTSYIYLFFVFAFIHSSLHNTSQEDVQAEKKHAIYSPGMVGGVSLVVVLLIFGTNINPARANMASLKAVHAVASGKDVATQYKETLRFPTPHIDDIRFDLARITFNTFPDYLSAGRVEEVGKLYELTKDELEKNTLLHPKDVRLSLLRAQLQLVGFKLTNNPELLLEAELILQEALKNSPKRQQIQYMLSGVLVYLQRPEEAKVILEQAIDQNPAISEGWVRLVIIYKNIGQVEKAKETIAQAITQGVRLNTKEKELIKDLLPENTIVK